MLRQTITNDGLVFSVNVDGHDIHFREWNATDDCIYYLPLTELVDNGYASFHRHECTVPFENVYLLAEDDRRLLGVPDAYDKAMRLSADGMLNTPDFRYNLEFLTELPNGSLIPHERCGNVLATKGTKYLLSEAQYELVNQVEDFNAADSTTKTTDYNLRRFSQIKELAIQAGCQLDSYLQNENVYVPETIKIEVGADGLGYTVEPSVDIEEKEQFKRNFDRMRRVQGVYPVQKENGERVRVVLNPQQKEALAELKAKGGKYRTREEVEDIVAHPTEYFDPDLFDLKELYSDRVIDIGVYKPRFFPFVSPYKSEWIAGATVQTLENGTTRVTVDNQKDLHELREAIADARERKHFTVQYKNAVVDVDDAEFLAATAEKQLSNPKVPVTTDGEVNGRKVLIIEENEEKVGFSTNEREIEASDKYTFHQTPSLNEGIELKQHQKEGVAWLQYLYGNRASGCLLADDMGLGKTLQILYFLDWHSRIHPHHKPYLIVAPVSLLENWENEYCRFFRSPRMTVNRLTSKDVPRQFNRQVVDRMQKMDIVLTNYESLRIAQLNFCAVEFDVAALDEAQKIKTPATLATNAAKALKAHFRIALTGTPVENSLLDLWCIMDFCVPGLLGNAKDFAAKFQNPLKSEDADIEVLGNEVHEKLGLFFMRRLKVDAAKDLPLKHELKQHVLMPYIQESTYIKALNRYKCGEQRDMLVTIMEIREISEHPYLYDSTLNQRSVGELEHSSARLQATVTFLDSIKSKDEKVIIFAERKDTQRMLQRVCLERYGLVPTIINGDTPSLVTRARNGKLSRQSAIDAYQRVPGFNVIIMSPVAAGMGLNVTAANHVIHYSRHWNPAKESQATDRAYRIGQTKDVYVYYPMAVSNSFKSFDLTLDDLLGRKTCLASSTIFPTERVEVRQEELGQMLFGSKIPH